jgi:hypothetical protein
MNEPVLKAHVSELPFGERVFASVIRDSWGSESDALCIGELSRHSTLP